MKTRAAVLATAMLLMQLQGAGAQDGSDVVEGQAGWNAVVLPQTEEIPALVTGVAVGPESIVAIGQRACERTDEGDLGHCWGQPWVSTDGLSWEAIPARTSGLDLGAFDYLLHGPQLGMAGVAHGPAGFVAYGWAVPERPADADAQGLPPVIQPTLWRSADGASWERLPSPPEFSAEGLMLRGPWLRAIAGTSDGYLLGGTIHAKPAPRAAIWSSPDGLDWTLAGPDEAFDIGAYIDTMEVPATGGINAFAVEPSSDGASEALIAVGASCPRAKKKAGPGGGALKQWDWTTGECKARVWRSEDAVIWQASAFRDADGERIERYAAQSVASTGDRSVVGTYPKAILYLDDASAWSAAPAGKYDRQRALAASDAGFHAFAPKCVADKCRRRTLAVWSSADGADWRLDETQPVMPIGVDQFLEVDTAPFGDRTVVTASFWTAPGEDLASMALLSPSWEEVPGEEGTTNTG